MKDLSSSKVYKSNALAEAGYRLSIQEQRIILAALSKIGRDDVVTDEVMYTVTAKSIAKLTGKEVDDTYTELKEAVIRLKRRDIKLSKKPNGEGNIKLKNRVLITGWVQTIAYIDTEGCVEIRFSKDILPYLSQLKEQFLSYNIESVAKFGSSYGIRLYELLVQWKTTGIREIEISEFKKMLDIQDKYPSIKDLKRWVIDPALKDINNHSDFWVKQTQRKAGRNVTHFIFNFGLKSEIKTKKVLPKEPKILGVPKSEIEKKARKGESYEEAAQRIKSESVNKKSSKEKASSEIESMKKILETA
jgi:plasmid replication initiation protein